MAGAGPGAVEMVSVVWGAWVCRPEGRGGSGAGLAGRPSGKPWAGHIGPRHVRPLGAASTAAGTAAGTARKVLGSEVLGTLSLPYSENERDLMQLLPKLKCEGPGGSPIAFGALGGPRLGLWEGCEPETKGGPRANPPATRRAWGSVRPAHPRPPRQPRAGAQSGLWRELGGGCQHSPGGSWEEGGRQPTWCHLGGGRKQPRPQGSSTDTRQPVLLPPLGHLLPDPLPVPMSLLTAGAHS